VIGSLLFATLVIGARSDNFFQRDTSKSVDKGSNLLEYG
jgi:hypothetical protein